MGKNEPFASMLSGGHLNSLGRTLEVVDAVQSDPSRFDELFACYQSADAVVRLRTSNAIKRLEEADHALLLPFIDRLIEEIGNLDQASAQWTLARLFHRLYHDMSAAQRNGALEILKRNLATHSDWIVLNMTMDALAALSSYVPDLLGWMRPHLERLSGDGRKSVMAKAQKLTGKLYRSDDEAEA